MSGDTDWCRDLTFSGYPSRVFRLPSPEGCGTRCVGRTDESRSHASRETEVSERDSRRA